MREIRIVGLSLVLIALVQPAHASSFDIFGFGARAQGMAGALAGGSHDYTAAYYNPAALTMTPHIDLGLGLSITVPTLYIDRSISDSNHDSVLPATHGGVNLGWKYPVGGILKKKVALGINLYVPAGRLIRIQGYDPSSPQFYLYQNLHDKLVIVGAIGYRPIRWLSFGIGIQALANLGGSATLRLDVIDEDFEAASAEVDVPPSGGLVAGLQVSPTPNFHIGLTYRGSTAVSFRLPVDAHIGEAMSLWVDVDQTVLWAPHQVSLGISYRMAKPRLTLAADLTLSMWSYAPDPSPKLAIDVSGKAIDGFGLGDALDVSAQTEPIELGFINTLTPRIGAEWNATSWLILRTGYFYRPTPAPKQTASYSYLDNNAHVVSLGVGFVFKDPFKIGAGPVQWDFAFQATVLPRRTVIKTAPDDPVGNLSHGGALWTMSSSIDYRY